MSLVFCTGTVELAHPTIASQTLVDQFWLFLENDGEFSDTRIKVWQEPHKTSLGPSIFLVEGEENEPATRLRNVEDSDSQSEVRTHSQKASMHGKVTSRITKQ